MWCMLLFVASSTTYGQGFMEQGKKIYETANAYRKSRMINANKEYQRAAIYLEKAQQEGFGEAAFLLGEMYYWGFNGMKDTEKALQMYQRAIELGHDRGTVQIGRCYLYGGNGVERDEKKTFELFAKGVEEKDPEARMYIALCWFFGMGVEEDRNVAIANSRNYTQQMVESEDTNFRIMLGMFCLSDKFSTKDAETGKLVQQDIPGAIEHFYNSRREELMLMAGKLMYENNIEYMYRQYYETDKNYMSIYDVLTDVVKTTDYDHKAAEACYLYATFMEKKRAYNGDAGMTTNGQMTRVEALTRAAQLGNKPAQKLLGDWYETGHNVSKNLIRAKEWHDRAAAQDAED